MNRIVLLALPFALAACDRSNCVRVTHPAKLLERPYPMNYPSTQPRPNRVVAVLAPGEYHYEATELGKDFQYFEIRTARAHGYLISGEETADCR